MREEVIKDIEARLNLLVKGIDRHKLIMSLDENTVIFIDAECLNETVHCDGFKIALDELREKYSSDDGITPEESCINYLNGIGYLSKERKRYMKKGKEKTLEVLKTLINSDYNDKNCKLLYSDLKEMLGE